MRSLTVVAVLMLSGLVAADAFGQGRGGGGGGGCQHGARSGGGQTQGGGQVGSGSGGAVDPYLAQVAMVQQYQLAQMQQAYLQKQLAIAHEQAKEKKLKEERRVANIQQRRAKDDSRRAGASQNSFASTNQR